MFAAGFRFAVGEPPGYPADMSCPRHLPTILARTQGVWAAHALLVLLIVGTCGISAADVIVVANRTDQAVEFEVVPQRDEQPTTHRLAPHESRPIRTSDALTLRLKGNATQSYELQPNRIVFWTSTKNGPALQEIGFSTPAREWAPQPAPLPPTGLIRVKLFLDDELMSRRNQERRLRERLAAASALFEKAAGVRFEVVDVGQWESINGVSSFEALLVDFERKVKVAPGELAVGYSQQASRSKSRLGGTRLPLHSHILLRERGQRTLSELAQREVLIHELGHYLGAVHSPEWSSVMRPHLADGLAGSEGFRIALDPVNTMVTFLVGEEIRAGRASGIWSLSDPVKSDLRRIYSDLAQALPEDPAARTYLAALDLESPPAEEPESRTVLATHARQVVQAITSAAEQNIQRPPKHIAQRYGKPHRLTGDELTETLVRIGAGAALGAPETIRAEALAIGLAVAMDDSKLLRDQALTRQMWHSIETSREQQFRAGVLGNPTLRDRRDLAQHYFVSAGLAAIVGPHLAEGAGLWKETSDGTFSRADYSADLAGIRLFRFLDANPEQISQLQQRFRIAEFVPQCNESVPHPFVGDPQRLRSEIMSEIAELPAYQTLSAPRGAPRSDQ